MYFLCFSAVICPNNEDSTPSNETADFVFGNTTGFTLFQMCWNKTNTVPLYLIIILLPLLNFRSPSFFAKFNVLGINLQSLDVLPIHTSPHLVFPFYFPFPLCFLLQCVSLYLHYSQLYKTFLKQYFIHPFPHYTS